MQFSGFSNRTEKFHFFFNSSFDCFCSRSKKFTWVKSFTLLIFAFFDVFTCSCCEGKLALSINVNFRYTKIDCFLDHICRDTCTTMKYKWHISCKLLDSIQSFET